MPINLNVGKYITKIKCNEQTERYWWRETERERKREREKAGIYQTNNMILPAYFLYEAKNSS
jgi:hypothetical protein